MQAEIIAIGSELTSGAKLDTNSQWLSLELSEIGIPVAFHATMADDRDAMLEVFQTAAKRSDIVLITGGLGPTLDDLTRELIAELLGTELVLDQPSLEFIQSLFEKRGRTMAERNRIQAMFPAGSEPVFNPIGTAPGIWVEVPRDGREPCLLAAMPGVPSEMKKMYREQIASRLPHGSSVIRRGLVHCFGRGESDIEQDLGELTARGRNPEVGITASSATITLRITARGSSIEDCDALIEADRRTIRETLGNVVFGEGDDTLESVLISMLDEADQSLSVIESGSHGLLTQVLSAASRESAAFVGGIVVSP